MTALSDGERRPGQGPVAEGGFDLSRAERPGCRTSRARAEGGLGGRARPGQASGRSLQAWGGRANTLRRSLWVEGEGAGGGERGWVGGVQGRGAAAPGPGAAAEVTLQRDWRDYRGGRTDSRSDGEVLGRTAPGSALESDGGCRCPSRDGRAVRTGLAGQPCGAETGGQGRAETVGSACSGRRAPCR